MFFLWFPVYITKICEVVKVHVASVSPKDLVCNSVAEFEIKVLYMLRGAEQEEGQYICDVLRVK